MDWPSLMMDYALPIVGAVVAGALIGLEREYRARPAGLRTHILVSLASALLMLAAVHQVHWLAGAPFDIVRIDPVRMAHGILTGIGFLCGGVIFRQGLSVHGLTTAASLWITSALGTLYGIGFYGLAISGTAATLAVLAGFRWFDVHMPQQVVLDVVVRYRRGEAFPEQGFRRLAESLSLRAGVLGHKLVAGGEIVELSSTLRGSGRFKPEHLSARLCQDPTVFEFEVQPRND